MNVDPRSFPAAISATSRTSVYYIMTHPAALVNRMFESFLAAR
jgi:hypothetical protein